MTKSDGRWHTAEIESVHIESRLSRLGKVQKYFHDIFPRIIHEPVEQEYVRFSSGKSRKIGLRVQSAEGVRFAYSDLPLPGDNKVDNTED